MTGQTNGTSTEQKIPGWAAQLKPEYRTPEVLRHADFNSFVADAIALGKDGVRVPGANATPEEREAFYSRLGRPESADKYEIKLPGDAPLDEKLVGSFKGVAHQLGLNNEQAQKLTEWYAGQAAGIMEAQGAQAQANKANWDAEVNKMWGWQTARNDAIAARTLMTMLEGKADHPIAKLLDETGLGNHPALRQFFYELGIKNGEDRYLEADQGPSEEDVASAQKELADLKKPDSPYWDARKPGYREARDRARRLYDTIHAAKS